MTEAEWLASVDLCATLAFAARVGGRKLHLFKVACCERIEPLLEDARSRNAFTCYRRFVEGEADERELNREQDEACAAWLSARRSAAVRVLGTEEFERLSQVSRAAM